MARSNITQTTTSLVDDNGSVIIPLVKGEQLSFDVVIEWLNSLNNFNIHVNIVEAVNDGEGTVPKLPLVGGVKRLLSKTNGYIIDSTPSDNQFSFTLPWDLHVGLAVQPKPDAPVYLFFELEVGSPGTGDNTSPVGDAAPVGTFVWKPIHGLIQLMYSPTEEV